MFVCVWIRISVNNVEEAKVPVCKPHLSVLAFLGICIFDCMYGYVYVYI